MEVNLGPVTALTFYDDCSRVVKDAKDRNMAFFNDSQLNMSEFSVDATPVFVYADLCLGKNMLWLGLRHDANFTVEAGNGNSSLFDDLWHVRFNVNSGYYF